MNVRHAALLAVAIGATACSSRPVVIEPEPAVYSTGRSTASADAALPSGARAATTNPNASTAATLGIPPGHLPPPGQCRVWIPGEPPGRQEAQASGDCAWVQTRVPPGGWLVWRPTRDRKEVVVREFGDRSVIRWTRIFDIATGALVHEDRRGG
jgi:hypothetical protein